MGASRNDASVRRSLPSSESSSTSITFAQLAGNTKHCGIGSDLDGGYGTEQTPQDLQSIADLTRLDQLLADRGYSSADREGIMHGNWVRLMNEIWS